jgi:hypothetical protein
MRPHNRYHNLYFVAASTHPGTDIPTALISARLSAVRLLEEMGVGLRENAVAQRLYGLGQIAHMNTPLKLWSGLLHFF